MAELNELPQADQDEHGKSSVDYRDPLVLDRTTYHNHHHRHRLLRFVHMNAITSAPPGEAVIVSFGIPFSHKTSDSEVLLWRKASFS